MTDGSTSATKESQETIGGDNSSPDYKAKVNPKKMFKMSTVANV